MSSSDDTTREFRDSISPLARRSEGMVRRMTPTITSGSTWQLTGHLLLENNRETIEAENLSGIGFFARPKAGHRCDAIVVYPGGPSNPIIIATRDEDARKAVAELSEDETAAFNSTTIVLIKGGTVEIRLAGGTALKLPTLADHQDVVNKLNDVISKFNNAHLPVVGGGGGTAGPPAVPVVGTAPNPTGTAVLKAQ